MDSPKSRSLLLDSQLKRVAWFGGSLLLLVLLAIRNRFIQDDAFISFRYADNLLRAGSLSWNVTDAVKIEGYTNFSWTMLIALLGQLGVEPIRASMVMGIVSGIGTLLVVHAIARLITQDFGFSLLAMLLLGTNFSFSSYMTGGLETQLQTFLLTLVGYCSIRAIQGSPQIGRYAFGAGLCAGLALLTRLDSAIVIGVLSLGTLIALRRRAGTRSAITWTCWLGAPLLLVVLPWLYWKYGYYGHLLPNSFYLKGRGFGPQVLVSGVAFLVSFFASYQLLIPSVLLLASWQHVRANPVVLTLLSVCGVWALYIVKVGGDFMEFRFMIPILPYLMLCFVWVIQRQQVAIVRLIAVSCIFFGSISHQLLFKNFHGIETIGGLDNFVNRRDFNWKGIGLKLGQLLPNPERGVTIAINAAGAIPYYSRLRAIDMLGVNDRWVALHGVPIEPFRPGHSKQGTLRYCLDTDVNLVIGHPQLQRHDWTRNRSKLALSEFSDFQMAAVTPDAIPSDARILQIPIDDEYSLFALYLKRSPEIDALVASSQARAFELN